MKAENLSFEEVINQVLNRLYNDENGSVNTISNILQEIDLELPRRDMSQLCARISASGLVDWKDCSSSDGNDLLIGLNAKGYEMFEQYGSYSSYKENSYKPHKEKRIYVSGDGIDPLSNLHEEVKKVASELYRDGHFRQAILDTYIALVEAVKKKSGEDRDGTPLMQAVFSNKNPKLILSKDPDQQLGFMWLYSGAVMAIRNPKAHRMIPQTDPQRTLEWLSFASVLFRLLDESEKNEEV